MHKKNTKMNAQVEYGISCREKNRLYCKGASAAW